jgi:hypothetical protein
MAQDFRAQFVIPVISLESQMVIGLDGILS